MKSRRMSVDFWRSIEVSKAVVEDRLLLLGLWSYVDDNGVGLDNVAHISADLFAGDLESAPMETFERVRNGLNRLADLGFIERYNAESKDLIYVTSWGQQRIDRPARPKYPLPDSVEE